MNRTLHFLTRWIDENENSIPFGQRLAAYIIDWVIGGIFSGLPAVLCYGWVTGRADMMSDLYVFPALGYETYWAFVAGASCILLAIIYYVIVPWKIYPGQTLGKKWMKIKIVTLDGKVPSLKVLLIRYVLGMFILENSSLVVCQYIRQMTTLALSYYVDTIWQWIGTILIILSLMLAVGTKSHRALHDYISKTKVILS